MDTTAPVTGLTTPDATARAPDVRLTATVRIRGQDVDYTPLSDDEVASVLARCTRTQALALHHVAKGLDRDAVAERTGCSIHTLDMWRQTWPAYKDAWYSLREQAVTWTPEAIRKLALGDAVGHYQALAEVVERPMVTARDAAVRVQAASKALEIAGVGGPAPVQIQMNFAQAVLLAEQRDREQGDERPAWR